MGDILGRIPLEPEGELRQIHGDLTVERVDAIVNAAKPKHPHGGGVAAAIVRAGTAVIRYESERWGDERSPSDHDWPAITSAGDLPCQALIHVVGPRWGEGDENAKLRTAVQTAMRSSEMPGYRSLAIAPISTGIFEFPVDGAAGVILAANRDFFSGRTPSNLKGIRIAIIDQPAMGALRQVLAPHIGPPAGEG